MCERGSGSIAANGELEVCKSGSKPTTSVTRLQGKCAEMKQGSQGATANRSDRSSNIESWHLDAQTLQEIWKPNAQKINIELCIKEKANFCTSWGHFKKQINDVEQQHRKKGYCTALLDDQLQINLPRLQQKQPWLQEKQMATAKASITSPRSWIVSVRLEHQALSSMFVAT